MKKQKVFNIAFHKAGTTSLAQAMELLGYKSIHWKHNDKPLQKIMKDNIDSGINPLDGLETFDFFSDFRGELFMEELYKYYSDAKFILTNRELFSWLNSRVKHVIRNQNNPKYTGNFLKIDIPAWVTYKKQTERLIKRFFKGKENQLLEVDIIAGDGWEKLCEFLEVDIPADISFPLKNSTAFKK